MLWFTSHFSCIYSVRIGLLKELLALGFDLNARTLHQASLAWWQQTRWEVLFSCWVGKGEPFLQEAIHKMVVEARVRGYLLRYGYCGCPHNPLTTLKSRENRQLLLSLSKPGRSKASGRSSWAQGSLCHWVWCRWDWGAWTRVFLFRGECPLTFPLCFAAFFANPSVSEWRGPGMKEFCAFPSVFLPYPLPVSAYPVSVHSIFNFLPPLCPLSLRIASLPPFKAN